MNKSEASSTIFKLYYDSLSDIQIELNSLSPETIQANTTKGLEEYFLRKWILEPIEQDNSREMLVDYVREGGQIIYVPDMGKHQSVWSIAKIEFPINHTPFTERSVALLRSIHRVISIFKKVPKKYITAAADKLLLSRYSVKTLEPHFNRLTVCWHPSTMLCKSVTPNLPLKYAH